MVKNSIFSIFAKSPIEPLQEHVKTVNKCSQALLPFFIAVFADNWEEAEKCQKKISDLENQADKLKRNIRLSLPGGLFMPVERQDLLELLTQQDRIANKAKDISGRILGRQLQIPSELREQFMAYLERSLDATKKAKKVINELDELLETGFKGREVKLVEEMIEELDNIEDETDNMQISLRKNLLALEEALNPVNVIFLYSIIEWVGELADISQRVGSRLALMLAR